MTDNEIIKALEICGNIDVSCKGCVFANCELCRVKLAENAFILINRLRAEIERLQKENNQFADIGKLYSEIKSEVIKEFAERFLKIVHDNHYLLVDRINSKDYGMFTIGIEQAVDETKKEMVGEDK